MTSPGTLVPIPGGVNSCSSAAGVVIDPLGLFVLITDSSQNVVCVESLDSETNASTPVPGSPFSTGGTSPERLAIDPSGQFVFVANSQSNNVSAFSLNLDTGALTPVPSSPFAIRSTARISTAALGTSTFTVKVADSTGQTASQQFSFDLLSGTAPGATATLPSSARAQGA